MTEKDSEQSSISRREFFEGTGMTTTELGTGGLRPDVIGCCENGNTAFSWICQ